MITDRRVSCPHNAVPAPQEDAFHELVATAAQAYLDEPERIPERATELFIDLAGNVVPSLRGMDESDATAGLATKSVDRSLKVTRGQQQAFRGALSYLALVEVARQAMPSLRGEEPVVQLPDDGSTYVDYLMTRAFPGEYHRFMLTGIKRIMEPSFAFIDRVRSPNHPYHPLLAATHGLQLQVRAVQLEKRERNKDQVVISDPGDLARFQLKLMANYGDTMDELVGVQMAYLSKLEAVGCEEPKPDEIGRLALANLEIFSLLSTRLSRIPSLRITPKAIVDSYIDGSAKAAGPMPQEPYADMPPHFRITGEAVAPKLELDPKVLESLSEHSTFCAGNMELRSPDSQDQATVEELLTVSGIPSRRPPGDSEYGKIDSTKIIVIIGTAIAKETIFCESPT